MLRASRNRANRTERIEHWEMVQGKRDHTPRCEASKYLLTMNLLRSRDLLFLWGR